MIPIYRAKKINDNNHVKGHLTWDSEFGIERIIQKEAKGTSRHSVDLSTLTISFDGGEHFNSLDYVLRAVENHREVIEIWKRIITWMIV